MFDHYYLNLYLFSLLLCKINLKFYKAEKLICIRTLPAKKQYRKGLCNFDGLIDEDNPTCRLRLCIQERKEYNKLNK